MGFLFLVIIGTFSKALILVFEHSLNFLHLL